MPPGLIQCYSCGAFGRLPEFEPLHKEGCEFLNDRQHCGVCDRLYNPNFPDPCLGRLPGVSFACCGHGGDGGYIKWEDGRCLRFTMQEMERPPYDENFRAQNVIKVGNFAHKSLILTVGDEVLHVRCGDRIKIGEHEIRVVAEF